VWKNLMARRCVGLFLALFLLSGQSLAWSAPPRTTASLAAIRAVDRRVATIGHRLAVANLVWCGRTEWRHGLVLLQLSGIAGGLRGEVLGAFGAVQGLGIMALAANGPAERAGLRPNDIITGFDGHPLPAVQASNQSWFAALGAAFEDGEAQVDILRGGIRMALDVRGERGCATVFQGAPRQSRDANADGVTVNVNVGLIDYVQDDDELAAVMAHEFAHNVLRHRDRLTATGRSSSAVRQTEIEADRFSVYLMERAGYDPEAAVRFWTRYGPHPLNFLRSRDHPGWRERLTIMQAEIARIREARAAGHAPVPEFVNLPWPG
jgi:membrane-associated protease RseP (regulator of RpoE activity)